MALDKKCWAEKLSERRVDFFIYFMVMLIINNKKRDLFHKSEMDVRILWKVLHLSFMTAV